MPSVTLDRETIGDRGDCREVNRFGDGAYPRHQVGGEDMVAAAGSKARGMNAAIQPDASKDHALQS